MLDLPTSLAIASLIVGIVAAGIAYLTLHRTPKLPMPSITPSSTTIMGVETPRPDDLPSYSKGVERMGFNRGRR